MMKAHCPMLNEPCRREGCGWWNIRECGLLTMAKAIEMIKFKAR